MWPRLRSAYLSVKRNMPLLWTFYDHLETGLTNTNNALEGMFSNLKSKVRVHSGISKEHRNKLIDEYIKRLYWNGHRHQNIRSPTATVQALRLALKNGSLRAWLLTGYPTFCPSAPNQCLWNDSPRQSKQEGITRVIIILKDFPTPIKSKSA